MRVKSLELINLKSYRDEKLNLSPNINILTGANNSGKSTIIKSLLNFQYNIFHKQDVRVSEEYARIYAEIVEVSESDNQRFYNPQHPKELEMGDAYTIIGSLSTGPQERTYLYFDSHYKTKLDEYHRIKIADKNGNSVPFKHFPGFPISEEKNNFIYPFLASRKADSYYDNNVNREDFFKVSETLRNLPSKVQKLENSSHPWHAEFVRCCEDILGFKVGTIPAEHNNGIQIGIYTDPTTTIPLRSMGDGVMNILGLITLLLTEDNKLYLIEELENDIHPSALKKLLNLIVEKSKNNQFIVSTHSHIVLKYLGVEPDSKLFYIDWSPKDQQNRNIPTSTIIEIENKPENRMAILEKLGYDFFDFELHESYLIMEESTAEHVVRDFLIPNIVPELYSRVKTISAQGTTDLEVRVQDFNRLFVFLHTAPAYYKKAWVLADGDASGKQCINNLRLKYKDSWPKQHFLNLTKEAFEYYYPDRFQDRVETILALPHGPKKQEKKVELMKEIMTWALSNRETAVKEFSKSANEVIQVLRNINKNLGSRKSLTDSKRQKQR